LPLDRAAQRVEAGPERREAGGAVADELFEAHSEALLAILPEIGLVLRVEVAVDVEEDEPDQTDMDDGFGPVLHEASETAPDLAAEQGRPIGVMLLEMIGDRAGIVHDRVAVPDDRHPSLIGRGQLVFFDKAPR